VARSARARTGSPIVKVAVVGVGGIGGCIGARLAAAGATVRFIARGAHLAALRESGLRLSSALGDVELPHVEVSADAAGTSPVDVVLLTVKGPDVVGAAGTIAPLVGPSTMIVPFLNGVEHVEILQRRFGAQAVVPGITYIAAVIDRPGRIRHVGTGRRSLLGEVDGTRSARVEAFRALAGRAGLEVEIVPDIVRALWEKFVLLAAFTAVACLSRLPVGVWTRQPDTLALFIDGMREIVAVAAAKGIALDAEPLIDANLAFMRSLEPDWKGSMLNDLERGKRIEIESLSGYVHRLGRTLGVPTPLHSTAYRALCHHSQASPTAGPSTGGSES
jgi:2-dehydropantoate 2-reductase